MEALRVVMLGPPGAGKGTQGSRIEAELGIDHVATGDILRANKDMETDHGSPREYMEAGELVPDPVMMEVAEAALSDRAGFVLDGYPRTVPQAEHLASVAPPDVILHLDADREELVERLSGRRVDPETGENYHVDFDMPNDPEIRGRLIQREDDRPESVERRLEVYDEQTAPLIEFYESDDGYERIDGNPSPDEVFEDIAATLRSHASEE